MSRRLPFSLLAALLGWWLLGLSAAVSAAQLDRLYEAIRSAGDISAEQAVFDAPQEFICDLNQFPRVGTGLLGPLLEVDGEHIILDVP